MKFFNLKTIAFLFLLAQGFFLQSQKSNLLQLEDIMQGEDFIGHTPQNISWSIDSKKIYYTKKNSNAIDSTQRFQVELKDTVTTLLVGQEDNYFSTKTIVDKFQDKYLLIDNEDIFIYFSKKDSLKKLTQNVSSKSPLRFNVKGDGIYFLEKNNIFLWEYDKGFIQQLTDFRNGEDKKEKPTTANEQWLIDQQMELFDIIKTQTKNKELNKARNNKPKIAPIYIGDKSLRQLTISSDGQYVFYTLDKNENSKNTDVHNYMHASGYAENKTARAKVGISSSKSESYIFNTTSQEIVKINTENLEGIRQKPDFLRTYHKDTSQYKNTFDTDRQVYTSRPVFNTVGEAIVEVRSHDNKDRWICQLNITSGQLETIDRQRDEAWIGGPGIYSSHIGWLKNGTEVWFLSEESGFSHIYIYNVKSKTKRSLTQGSFEVLSTQLSHDEKTFFVTANAQGPHEHHFYHVDAETGRMTQITKNIGGHEVHISPDEKHLAINYSYSNRPWELYWMLNEPNAKMQQLTTSTTAQFQTYPWIAPEIVEFTASDGVKVPARIYAPDKKIKNGRAVLFVHGAGYLQNVHHWWSSYHREYMFHHFLMERGYTVLDIDYRGSKGYGRDWRTAIYRHMGGRDLEDFVDGAQYLVKEHGINPEKIGIYGGSYGGFITLMALFTSPHTFRSGAALRSVTDWAHYNHGYTSNILNTPTEDPDAYRKSSPIYHADGLKNDLLILHGILDVNVQFQDVVRLSQRLIELKKDNWEMAVYPIEDHGFRYTESWLDEYKRIFSLFERTLK